MVMNLSERTLAALDRLTAALPGGGERRSGQREMAAAVAKTARRDSHLVVQAGTGTGKSLAYLLPAVLSGTRIVVATATKALQDQLARKDLPFVAQHLAGAGGDRIEFAVLKGRSNYLCRQRLDEAEHPGQLDLDDAGGGLDRAKVALLRRFESSTASGDRADLKAALDDASWGLVSVSSEECPGATRCRRGRDCFAERARQRADRADIVVVNQHLYALHIATGAGLGTHDLVVIDEVHQFEEIVAEAISSAVTPGRVNTLARAASAVLDAADPITALEAAAKALRSSLAPALGERLADGPDPEMQAALTLLSGRIDRVVQALRELDEDLPDRGSGTASDRVRQQALRARLLADSLREDISKVRVPTERKVIWVGGRKPNPSLRATPLRIDELLSEALWSQRAAVLTSATVPANLSKDLGLPEGVDQIDVGSPFDYAANAVLYCPLDLPDPNDAGRSSAVHEELEALIAAAGGRTLALFTSYRAMNSAAGYLESRLPGPLLVQGSKSKAALLAEFSRVEESSLLATISFWQGVDVTGRSCSLVTIDRLPFPRPDDPVLAARRELAGPNAFREIDLPRAATLLAQGAGRLIRSAGDRGVVAVLDPRLATKRGYRWALIDALPAMRRSSDRDEVLAFLRILRDQ